MPDSETSADLVRRANELNRLGQHAEALEVATCATTLAPESVSAWRAKASSLWHLHRYPERIAAYRSLLDIDPNDGRAWYCVAAHLFTKGTEHWAEALDAAMRVTQLPDVGDKRLALAWYMVAAILNSEDRHEEGLLAADRSIELDAEASRAWHKRSVALAGLDRPEEALEAERMALSVEPENVQYLISLAIRLGSLDRWAEALPSATAATRLASHDARMWYVKYAVLLNLEMDKQAIEALEHAVELDPTDGEWWCMLAALYYKHGRYQDAIRAATKSSDLNPNDKYPRAFKAMSFLRTGHLKNLWRMIREEEGWEEPRG